MLKSNYPEMHGNLQLRDYQQILYDSVRVQFRAGNHKILAVAPCGAGKTAVAAAMMRDTMARDPDAYCLMLVHRRELLDQHMKTLESYGVDTSRIRVESVFTEAKHLGKKPKLLILDEAHLSKAASWEKVVKEYDTWTVGFSATPCRLDGRPLGDIFDAMVTSITYKELEAQHRLAPFDYYAPCELDLSGVKRKGGDFDEHQIEDLVMTRTIYGNVIDSYNKFASGRRTIAFCVSVKHSKEIAELFNKNGIPAASLDGSMSKSARSDIMQQFRDGTIQVLSSCNIISEGIGVDECDCCLLLRPTDSLALYIQQSWRCLRYMPGKRAVILDMVGNYTRHGLPDMDREWTLDKPVKRRSEFNPDGTLQLRTCSYCFKAFETAPICPYCGAPYDLHPREIKRMEEIRLELVDKERFEAEQARKAQAAIDIRNARSRADFEAIAAKNGYSKKWVNIRCKLRNYK